MEAYESEYVAPPYSIITSKVIGQKVITAVVLDGELVEFEKYINDQDASSN